MIPRRDFLASFAAAGLSVLATRPSIPSGELRQFHNQPADTPLHKRLVEMWAAVEKETNGKVRVRTFPENDHIPGGDPAAFKMLLAGELDFLTLMGGLIAPLVPAAQVQGIPFAFQTYTQAYDAMDGDLGDYLRKELQAKGIYAVRSGCFENGFRHITSTNRPINNAADLAGLKMRVPNSPIFVDLFQSLGSTPVVFNVSQLYECLKTGAAEAEENALAVVEAFKLYEIQKYVSLTGHMWSGFNQLANLERWTEFPPDVQNVIERNTAKYVKLQRADNQAFNRELEMQLSQRGMKVNKADTVSFRARLGPFYARWKKDVGTSAWTLLEGHTGKLS